MSASFRRFEILLPRLFNDGRSVPEELFTDTLLELRQHFCALDSVSPVPLQDSLGIGQIIALVHCSFFFGVGLAPAPFVCHCLAAFGTVASCRASCGLTNRFAAY